MKLKYRRRASGPVCGLRRIGLSRSAPLDRQAVAPAEALQVRADNVAQPSQAVLVGRRHLQAEESVVSAEVQSPGLEADLAAVVVEGGRYPLAEVAEQLPHVGGRPLGCDLR